MLQSHQLRFLGLKLLDYSESLEFAGRSYKRDAKGRFARIGTTGSAEPKKAGEDTPTPRRSLKATTDKIAIKSKMKEWSREHEEMVAIKKTKELKQAVVELKDVVQKAENRRQDNFVLPKGIELSGDRLTRNKKYHDKKFTTYKDSKDGMTFHRFKDGKIGATVTIKADGFHHVSLKHIQGTTSSIAFRSEKEADKFLATVLRDYADKKIIPVAAKDEVVNQAAKELREANAKIKNSGYKKQDLEVLDDNIGISAEIASYVDNKKAKLIGVVDDTGKLQSSAKYHAEGGHIYVDYLATAPWNLTDDHPNKTKGAGAKALANLAKISVEQGYGGKLKLTPLDKAKPFYKHLGFEVDDRAIDGMKLSREAAQKLIEKYGD